MKAGEVFFSMTILVTFASALWGAKAASAMTAPAVPKRSARADGLVIIPSRIVAFFLRRRARLLHRPSPFQGSQESVLCGDGLIWELRRPRFGRSNKTNF